MWIETKKEEKTTIRSPPNGSDAVNRRDPTESLNVCRRTKATQYSTCSHFLNQIFSFFVVRFLFCINFVITPDVTEMFVCKH